MVVLQQNKDVITFDVNEALYFENGQEIAEMVSISLDPEIAIQTYEQYIQVRGFIILQGEYVKLKNPQRGNDDFIERATDYIEQVIDLENNQAQLTHRFPVEISVPSYRVDNEKDVTVSIDSFDYELPDETTLKIKASVHIHGIKSEAIEESKLDQMESEKENLQKERDSMKEATIDIQEVEEITELVTDSINHIEEDVFDKELEEKSEVVQVEEMKTEILESNQNEIDIQLNESEEDQEEEVKDVRFLTDLFGGEETESYARMRIYITQPDDTIETIAKQFEISALQLLKDNNISGDYIEEGQLLRLPIRKENNK